MGNLQLAADTFNRILSIDPGESKAAYNLANTMYSLGDFTAAVEMYTRAISLVPGHGDAYNNMANALKDSGQALRNPKP